jgi:hypothetical protein
MLNNFFEMEFIMENTKQERLLAYTLSTPLNSEALGLVTGGAHPGANASTRVVITGDHSAPDLVVEL